jgi:predicted permease
MWRRLAGWMDRLRHQGRAERDLHDELAFHLRARTEHWLAQGLPADEAARRARLEFGGLEGYKDVCRDARRPRLLAELAADLRYGARALRATPVFAAVSVAILALAIGANLAVTTVVHAVMWRVLPVDRPHDLRELSWTAHRERGWPMSYDGSMRPYGDGQLLATSFSYPVYTHLRDRTTTFSDLFLFAGDEISLGVAGRQHRVSVLLVSGNFFGGLGARMRLGRPIQPGDDRPDAAPVAVITSRAWQRLFKGDPNAIGATVAINGVPAAVAGVAAAGFDGVEPGWPVDVILPVTRLLPIVDDGPDRFAARRWAFRVMGRVRPGVDDAQVRAETEVLFLQAVPVERRYQPRLLVASGAQGLDSLRRNYAEPLRLLLAIMAVVLLIGCANIAGLQLVRTASRQREMAVGGGGGAGRGRRAGQVLTESVLLAAMAGAPAIALALAVRDRLLPLLNLEDDPIEFAVGFGASMWVVSVGLCVAAGLLCGVPAAVRAARSRSASALVRAVPGWREGTRLAAGRTLIGLQVALSLVLLVGAGLFAGTLARLRAEPLGFQPDRVLLFELDASDAAYRDSALLDFYGRLLERVIAIPGVDAASMSRYGLLSGGATRDGFMVATPAGRQEVGAHLHFISSRHFETMGIPLVAGRDFVESDGDTAPRVAIVNRALAAALPGPAPALGRQIEYGAPGAFVQIVGVVGDARFTTLREAPPPTLYLPYRQYPQHRMTFALRTVGDPVSMAAAARRAAEAVDPDVPVYAVRTQEAQIDDALRRERLFAWVASGFAALALGLACLGIYATLGYSVARRVPEIGLRVALGASRREVITMILGESLAPVTAGIVAGLAAAWMTTGFIRGMLFGLTPFDGPTVTMATAALLGSALVAAWLPARRASAVDPMIALRAE